MHDSHTTLREALHADHARLDKLFEALLSLVHVDDRAGIPAAWTAFERGLSTHLDIEETMLLPVLEREDAGEADRVRSEHATIRKLLAELGVGVEIHIVREETVERFVQFLRAHADHEEAVLYRWADRTLAEEPRASILERLRMLAAG